MLLSLILRRPLEAVVSKDEAGVQALPKVKSDSLLSRGDEEG